MKPKNIQQINLIKSVLLGLTLFLLASAILNGDTLILKFIKHHEFKVIDNYNAKLDLSSIPRGEYFLSFGRIRGPCDLIFDGNVLPANNLGKRNTRFPLAFSSFVKIGKHVNQSIEIKCKKIEGFPGGIKTHKLIALNPTVGPLIQLYRELTVVYLGPFAAIFLALVMIAFLTGLDDYGKRKDLNNQKKRSIIFFRRCCKSWK